MSFAACKVVAEIGCCHLGSMERARRLVHLAATCGVDYVKFQKRNPQECVPNNIKDKPHPNADFSYGSTYLEHREALELNADQHAELKLLCDEMHVKYCCSVWDYTSANEIIGVNPYFIKIPSACNHNFDFIQYVLEQYGGDVHISTGMAEKEKINDIIQFLVKWSHRIVIYHCTSIYPCSFEKLHLLEIEELCAVKKLGMRVGFSNHGYGIASDIAAYVLGAEYIERHFIDDRTIKHTDAAASLEAEGMRRLCRDLRNIRLALTYKDELSIEELEQSKKLRIL